MSKDKNAQKTEKNNVVEQTVESDVVEQTVEEVKARAILRTKLPALNELNLNFEKRTGSVFTATIVKVFNEDGEPVMEDGVQKEKFTRKVIDILGEDGLILDKYASIVDELNQKRAAAFVLGADTYKGKLLKKQAEIQAELEDITIDLDSFDVTLHDSSEVVMSVILPEKATRVNVSAKLTAATDKLVKLRAMLLAMGLSEEEINEQINS